MIFGPFIKRTIHFHSEISLLHYKNSHFSVLNSVFLMKKLDNPLIKCLNAELAPVLKYKHVTFIKLHSEHAALYFS